MKVFILRKRILKIFSIFVLLFAFVICAVCSASLVSRPALAKTIVIDAGHGGIDGGASGDKTGVTESELNLRFAKCLEKLCKEFGYNTVLTRSDMNGLYDENAANKKKSEMEKRKRIIKNCNPDLILSIHMNSFSMSGVRGVHVFYANENKSGEALANSISKSLASGIEYAYKIPKVGDYYILNCTEKPAVLVECGFLSNAEEELLLQNEEYIERFCYYLFCGVLKFYTNESVQN